MHARFTRAIHDWEVTFVQCARMRCCGRTFTVTPPGLTPRSRYSDRVIRLSRNLASMSLSVRQIARILRRIGVTVTPQSVHAWTRGVERQSRAVVRVTSEPQGPVSVPLRKDLYLSIRTRSTRSTQNLTREVQFCG